MQQCEDAGCGEYVIKKKKCYKCKGNNPIGCIFDDPPGCPKGWQDTWEDLKCDNCEDPLVDEWLNHPQIIGTHCCELHLQLSGYEGGAPGPQCYNTWEQLGGDPSINPHECCPDQGGMPPDPSTDGESDFNQDTTTYLQPKDKLRERFKKLAGLKKNK